MNDLPVIFDVFLSHPREEGAWVERLAASLEDKHRFKVWLDRWTLVPGGSWQQEMAKGLNEARTCAVCVGSQTPDGWFKEEIERALDIQTRRSDFRTIPVLLPDASPDLVPDFLRLKTWADFRNGHDFEYALHVLSQGIKGLSIGRWPIDGRSKPSAIDAYAEKLRELQRLKEAGLHEEVMIEFERKILNQWLEGKQ